MLAGITSQSLSEGVVRVLLCSVWSVGLRVFCVASNGLLENLWKVLLPHFTIFFGPYPWE